MEFPLTLLSRFEYRYCLNHSDAILIMIEYFKFITICRLNGGNFSPSKWVDQFWHHHISFDTKHYRDFWESFTGGEIEHQEHDSSNMNEEEKLSHIEKYREFKKIYKQMFNEFPPKSVWPEPTIESCEKDDVFVNINIYKTLYMKWIIKLTSPKNIENNKLNLEFNEFSKLKKQNKSVWKSIKTFFGKAGDIQDYYIPILNSYEDKLFKGDIFDEQYAHTNDEYDESNVSDEELKTNDITWYKTKEEYKKR